MLPTKLYLDTARLGQTSPSALQAQIDFARLTAEDPSSLYFEKFLRDGVDACPEIADQFPGLAHWHGIADLKRRLASMAGDPDQLRVLLANRSAELMRLAARCQFQVCRNVLVTDLSWPNWLAILKEEAERASGRVTTAHISRSIMRDRCSSDDVCHHLNRVYASRECDGLFLPIVSNLGVHLPVAKIVVALRAVGSVSYTIADGAQALNHVDLTKPMKVSDFIVAGAHKWLCSGSPMGVALVRSTRSDAFIDGQDALLQMTQRAGIAGTANRVETANIAGLFACDAALRDYSLPEVRGSSKPVSSGLEDTCDATGWRTLKPQFEFCSRIAILESRNPQFHSRPQSTMREAFQRFGVCLSAYPAGLIRLSLQLPAPHDELQLLRLALQLTSGRPLESWPANSEVFEHSSSSRPTRQPDAH